MFLEGCFQSGSYGDHNFPFKTDDNLSFLDNLDCIRSANTSQEDGIDECDECNEDEGMDENPVKTVDDNSYPVKFSSRKSSKRQRNKSATKDNSSNIYDKDNAREHLKKNGKSSTANKQRHTKAERKRQHADNRDKLKSGVQKQTQELLWKCSPSANRYQPDHEVDRLLAMADIPEEDLDPFKVLGVEVMATDAELKKAYRQLAVL
eukprot:g29025.t1